MKGWASLIYSEPTTCFLLEAMPSFIQSAYIKHELMSYSELYKKLLLIVTSLESYYNCGRTLKIFTSYQD